MHTHVCLGNCDCNIDSVSIAFPSNSKGDALFHPTSHINIRSSLIHPHGFQLVMLLMWLIEVSSFICTNNKSASKVKFRQASNCCKRVLETAKLVYVNKTKESITFLGVDLTF